MGIGFFRLVLALTVVITHTHPIFGFTLGNPVIAVRTFFIISGFYMTLVLREKYKNNQSFLTNRFLKIYPIYWVTLGLTVLSCLGAYWFRGNWGEMTDLIKGWNGLTTAEKGLILGSQLTIFGRGLVMFGEFGAKSGIAFLLVPQAWTLVLELWFYLVAPWLVRNGRFVVMAMVFSILIRKLVVGMGGSGDLWEYRFFPSELVYFLMGVGSYYIYKKIQSTKPKIQKFGWFFLIVATGALSTFNFWPGDILVREWWFYILMMGLIPLMFVGSKSSLFDRRLGDLSYPVYITHILVNNILYPLLLLPMSVSRNWQAPVVMAGSVCLSILINYFIQRPIEAVRVRGTK